MRFLLWTLAVLLTGTVAALNAYERVFRYMLSYDDDLRVLVNDLDSPTPLGFPGTDEVKRNIDAFYGPKNYQMRNHVVSDFLDHFLAILSREVFSPEEEEFLIRLTGCRVSEIPNAVREKANFHLFVMSLFLNLKKYENEFLAFFKRRIEFFAKLFLSSPNRVLEAFNVHFNCYYSVPSVKVLIDRLIEREVPKYPALANVLKAQPNAFKQFSVLRKVQSVIENGTGVVNTITGTLFIAISCAILFC